ncbi:MAG: hypothetical protein IPI98_02900 [Chitinophagaceae bacterium]|nr:hypothetical protein [Chitinophagaceae bacterium]
MTIEEQTQIVQEIESRLSVTDNLEFVIRNSIEKAEALRQSILKKAFEVNFLSQAEIEQCKQAEIMSLPANYSKNTSREVGNPSTGAGCQEEETNR